jgi:hypothetical protein
LMRKTLVLLTFSMLSLCVASASQIPCTAFLGVVPALYVTGSKCRTCTKRCQSCASRPVAEAVHALCFLSEERGLLSGRFWARYRIPDRPVSPEVQFRVSGASQKGDTTTIRWASDDSANGQMKDCVSDSLVPWK